ncbi:MAG TPA: heme o synthase [Candidatus Microsaccharimonas sp.]|nr:heme o synthase [Candidatus Microsaccharimonas sp.]
MKLRTYYELTKPGIIYANVLTATAGYLYGSKWHVHAQSFLGVVIGTSLIIAGACVYNNLLDRKIDTKMKRTQKRALVTGEVSASAAFIYATTLTLVGFLLLPITTNFTVLGLGGIGFIDYVALYGWTKRHTPFSTIVGSVSGAVSVAAGSAAASGRFGMPELMLFLLLVVWQMPHFYAIGLYRRKDYAAAGLPIMPVRRSAATAKLRIMGYIVGLLILSVVFWVRGYGGVVFLVLAGGLSLAWLAKGLQAYRTTDGSTWGKQMFLFSLIVNLGLSLAIAIGSVTI